MLRCVCARMLSLFLLLAKLFGGSNGSEVTTPAILVSSSPTSTVYSCFSEKENETVRSAKEACCRGVVEVWQAENENDRGAFFGAALRERCTLEMAQVPQSTENAKNQLDVAQFSWIVSKTAESLETPTSTDQYLWTTPVDGDKLQRDSVQTTTPYHKPDALSNSALIASKVDSHLGKDGGMHRLFHHRFLVNTNKDASYFLYVTIPQGMFIDLDDPIESTTGIVQSTSTESPDAGHSFVVTTTEQASSFRARLHAATVCDIEQPSFVSGQHLLVWEIDQIQTSCTPPILEFATKLHLRYPHPSQTLEQWIDLPSPLLFVNSETNTTHNYDWELKVAERVWVAAGKDEDHDWIMGMTIFCCLIGVGIMLRDVSRVSLWDDV